MLFSLSVSKVFKTPLKYHLTKHNVKRFRNAASEFLLGRNFLFSFKPSIPMVMNDFKAAALLQCLGKIYEDQPTSQVAFYKHL